MQFKDQEAVLFLNGPNTIRDGNLVGLSISAGDNEWDPAIILTFDVPQGLEGSHYTLELRGTVQFAYEFSSEHAIDQIEMMKCLWIDDRFYLSLDPWDERERFISSQDNDCFNSKSATLTVLRGATRP